MMSIRFVLILLGILMTVACAKVTVDSEQTVLPLPVAAPVTCAAKTAQKMTDSNVSTPQKIVDGIFAIPLFFYRMAVGTALAPL
jgi:hypothetical protein